MQQELTEQEEIEYEKKERQREHNREYLEGLDDNECEHSDDCLSQTSFSVCGDSATGYFQCKCGEIIVKEFMETYRIVLY
jgi:hypothetical protein